LIVSHPPPFCEVSENDAACVPFFFSAVLEWQERHDNRFPDEESSTADELELIANGLLKDREVNVQVISQVPRDQIEWVRGGFFGFFSHAFCRFMAATAAYEFSPICAVVGGMLAQDILKTLAAKDAPMANFFTFDGDTGAGTVCRLGM
jgi:ubiquitin-like 1-activating enzyme E1 A